jgi:hypothetical protein
VTVTNWAFDAGQITVGVLLIVAAPIGVWRAAFRPEIVIDGHTVTIVNAIRTYRLPLPDIQSVTPGLRYFAIDYLDDGARRFVLPQVLPGGAGYVPRRSTRIAAEITSLAATARGQQNQPSAGS